jgi:hypothetical protein
MKIANEENSYFPEEFPEEENMFGECEKVLDEISRVVSVHYKASENSFHLVEECDTYFSKMLTAENCKDLSELFLKISHKIEKTVE